MKPFENFPLLLLDTVAESVKEEKEGQTKLQNLKDLHEMLEIPKIIQQFFENLKNIPENFPNNSQKSIGDFLENLKIPKYLEKT